MRLGNKREYQVTWEWKQVPTHCKSKKNPETTSLTYTTIVPKSNQSMYKVISMTHECFNETTPYLRCQQVRLIPDKILLE